MKEVIETFSNSFEVEEYANAMIRIRHKEDGDRFFFKDRAELHLLMDELKRLFPFNPPDASQKYTSITGREYIYDIRD